VRGKRKNYNSIFLMLLSLDHHRKKIIFFYDDEKKMRITERYIQPNIPAQWGEGLYINNADPPKS